MVYRCADGYSWGLALGAAYPWGLALDTMLRGPAVLVVHFSHSKQALSQERGSLARMATCTGLYYQAIMANFTWL